MAQLKHEDLVNRKNSFSNNGESIAEWARENGFSLQLVYRVLNGKSKALRGESHKIAVKLGIKKVE